jgi:hypothetical protein
MPADEWIADVSDPSTSTSGFYPNIARWVDIDSIYNSRKHIRSIVRNASNGVIETVLNTNASGEAFFYSGAQQRIWCMALMNNQMDHEYVYGLQAYRVERFHFLRGAN